MSYLSHRHKSNKSASKIVGIEITNNSLKSHDLSFLGLSHKKPPEGVKYSNAFGETIYDDAYGLLELRNWLNSAGVVKISITRLQSSSNYYLSAKKFTIRRVLDNEYVDKDSYYLSSLLSHDTHRKDVIDIPKKNFNIDLNTSLELTEVQPNEKVIVIMILADDKEQVGNVNYDSVVETLDKKTDKNNRRKLLLIM